MLLVHYNAQRGSSEMNNQVRQENVKLGRTLYPIMLIARVYRLDGFPRHNFQKLLECVA